MRQELITLSMLLGLMGTAPMTSSQAATIVAQQQSVRGTVVDENGEPLIGVTVQIIGQAAGGTITDIDGKFSLNVSKGAKLRFSYVGYSDQMVTAEDGELNIKLLPDNKSL